MNKISSKLDRPIMHVYRRGKERKKIVLSRKNWACKCIGGKNDRWLQMWREENEEGRNNRKDSWQARVGGGRCGNHGRGERERERICI